MSNPKSLFFSFIVNVVFLSLVRIPFFIAPKLSQNNFKNQIVWEVLVGAVLVVGELVAEVVEAVLVGAGRCWLGYKVHSLWREILEGWKGEEVREGTCS